MTSTEGKLLTSDEDIKKEAVKHYEKVFDDKPMEESIKHLKEQREQLCNQRLEAARKNKTPPWTLEDVKVVLKDLKKKISKDPYDLPNELFVWSYAGDDLVLAILKLMNKMKDQLIFPKCLQICNVTNAYKNKGDGSRFDSYRGLFRIPVF